MEWVYDKPVVYIVSEMGNKVNVFEYNWLEGMIGEKL